MYNLNLFIKQLKLKFNIIWGGRGRSQIYHDKHKSMHLMVYQTFVLYRTLSLKWSLFEHEQESLIWR
jgi:hypothetical protein